MSKARKTLVSAAAWRFSPLKYGRMAIAIALGLFGLGAKAVDSLTMDDFAHKIKLQVNGYTGTETLSNFPVLVRISESGIPAFSTDVPSMMVWTPTFFTIVPEPSALLLLLIGGGLISLKRRRSIS